MLHLLKQYAEKRGLVAEPGYQSKDVLWCISFDEKGRYLGIVPLGDTSDKRNRGRTFFKCPNFSFSEMKAGGKTKCHFLVETTNVVTLYGTDQIDPKTADKHKYFITLLRDAGKIMPEFNALADNLESVETLRKIQTDLKENKAKPNAKITFRIGSEFPVESGDWHDWWDDYRKNHIPPAPVAKGSKAKKGNSSMCDFLSGRSEIPMAVHPPIKGLSSVGGQPAGDRVVSFKMDSFCSYGLEQSANSAISEINAYKYSTALSYLINKEGGKLADSKVVHWFKEEIPPKDDPLHWLIESDKQSELSAQQRARELLESIRTGKRADLQSNFYYAFTLSGAAGRVMIRDWMEGQFEELVDSINSWFKDLEIVARDGQGLAYSPKFMAVLGATVRVLKDLPAPFVSKMWRVATRNEPIPETALARALYRFRVDVIEDNPSNHARIGLLKAYHIRKDRINGKESTMKETLNKDHPHPAYHCGRLLAVLADLQRCALGDVGAGVVQRYYAAASATPALILGNVTKISQHHLNKLDGGLAHWFESKIADVWCRIGDAVPTTLTLEEQSLFALGYYQQLADLRKPKSDNDENNKEK